MLAKETKAPATVIEKSYASKSHIGADNKKEEEHWSSQNIVERTQEGKVISERRQRYRDKDGKEKIAVERMLDGKGKKFISEKRKPNEEAKVQDVYYNLDETESDEFDKLWNDYSKKVDFAKKKRKLLYNDQGTKLLKDVKIEEEK